jgi:DNA-binding MarR family transcriptional regulator
MVDQQDDLSRTAIISRLLRLQATLGQAAHEQPWVSWMDLDLTMPQFKLLLLVASRNGARVGDLAQRLGVTPPSVTTLLDRLEDQSLVRREDDPIDRRLVIARLTAHGRRLLQRLNLQQTDPLLSECLSDLSNDDLHALQVGLEALHQAWLVRQAARALSGEPEAC